MATIDVTLSHNDYDRNVLLKFTGDQLANMAADLSNALRSVALELRVMNERDGVPAEVREKLADLTRLLAGES